MLNQPPKELSRIDKGSLHGWRAIAVGKNKTVTKHFKDSDFGGSLNSFSAAEEWIINGKKKRLKKVGPSKDKMSV
jgi:hypothetical protein